MIQIVESRDPHQVSEAVAKVVDRPRIEATRRNGFKARVEVGNCSRFGMMIVEISNFRAHIEGNTGYTSVNLPLAGSITTDQGTFHADPLPRAADITASGLPFSIRSAGSTTMVLRLDDSLLRDAVNGLTGCRQRANLNFDGVLNLRSREGRAFFHRANLAWSEIHAGVLADPNISPKAELEIASDFLLAADAAGKPALERLESAPDVAAIDSAVDWIMSRLAEPISRADLCEATGLHVRTLTRGFRRVYDVGPMQFVRQQRLDAVRRVLLASRPEETSVTRIAEDFGMYHLGRFACDYQQRYKERPVDTLRR